MDDEEDFLAAVEADNKGVPEEPVKVEVVEPTPPPQPEPAAEPAPQTPAEPETLELTEPAPGQPKPEPGFVPLAAMLDARDRAKAAEAELARLREQAQQAQQQQPVQAPDPYEDPEGFAEYQEAKVRQLVQTTALNMSERFARKEHGSETVDAAKAWALQKFAADPLYHQQVLNDPDPYDRTVRDWQREQLFAQVQDPKEIEQFKAWKAAQNQLQTQQAAPAAPPTSTSAIPPPSLASAPSAGTILTEPVQSDEEIFNEVVGKR